MQYKRIVLLSFLLFISSAIAIFVFKYIESQQKEEHLKAEQEILKVTYATIADSFQTQAEILFLNRINTPEIKEIFKHANSKNEKVQTEAREKLFEALIDVYNGMQLFKLKQLHFHLPNNDSFLRFHRPMKFGDNLTQVRTSIKIVNETLKPVYGFEEGRIFNGYRFVFPMMSKKNEHIGSVETSVSMKNILDYLKEKIECEVDFMIDRVVVDEKVFKEEQKNYSETEIFKNFLHEWSISKSGNEIIKRDISEYIEESESNKESLNQALKQGEYYSFFSKNDNHIITFLPIKNILKNNVAYIIIQRKHHELQSFKVKTIIFLIVSFFLLSLVLYVYLNLEKSKAEIKKKDDFLNHIQKVGNIGFLEYDLATKRLIISDDILRLLGFNKKKEKENYTNYLSAIHEADKERIQKIHSESLKNRQNYNISYRIKTAKNEFAHFEHNGTYVFDSKGKIIKIIGIIQDITELKYYKHQLEISKKQYQSIVKNIPDVLFRCSTDRYLTMLHLGSSISEITGFQASDFILNRVRSFESLVHQNDKEKFNNKLLNNNKYEIEYRVLNSLDEYIWVKEIGQIVENDNGLDYIEGIIQNINIQKQAFQKLYDFIEKQPNIIIILNKKNKITFANKVFLNFFGYENIDSFNKKFECICHKFIQDNDYFHLQKMGKNKNKEFNWLEYIQDLDKNEKVVVMQDSNNLTFKFRVSIDRFEANNFIVNFEDITKFVDETNKYRKNLIIDPLTNIYNSTFLKNNFREILNKITENKTEVGIVVFSIGNLDEIKYKFGHKQSDEVIKHIAKITENMLETNETIVKWSKDVFIIFKKFTDEESFKLDIEIIRKTIQTTKLANPEIKLDIDFTANKYDQDKSITDNIHQVLNLD
jgi:diguanylate cyclase (GGDEF)-like protein/PAS domain S-box-containing protein